jgi:hypothetical protein
MLALGQPALAADATWSATPGSGDFNDPNNWNPTTVPDGTAIFDASANTNISIASSTTVGGFTIDAGAVAFDGLKGLLPLFAAWQWRDGRKLRATAVAGLFVLVAAYGLASVLGFASQNREGVTASQENPNASLKEHTADLESAEKRLKALGAHRVSGTIEADIAKLKQDRLWDSTRGCTEATLPASRDFCKGVEALRAELALAATDTVLSAKIEGLRFRTDQLRGQGGGRAAAWRDRAGGGR